MPPSRIVPVVDHAEQQLSEPVTAANTAIQAFIHTLPGGRITPADRPEYERLVRVYLDAVRQQDQDGEPEGVRLAA